MPVRKLRPVTPGAGGTACGKAKGKRRTAPGRAGVRAGLAGGGGLRPVSHPATLQLGPHAGAEIRYLLFDRGSED